MKYVEKILAHVNKKNELFSKYDLCLLYGKHRGCDGHHIEAASWLRKSERFSKIKAFSMCSVLYISRKTVN